jgi:hypothetical protein
MKPFSNSSPLSHGVAMDTVTDPTIREFAAQRGRHVRRFLKLARGRMLPGAYCIGSETVPDHWHVNLVVWSEGSRSVAHRPVTPVRSGVRRVQRPLHGTNRHGLTEREVDQIW